MSPRHQNGHPYDRADRAARSTSLRPYSRAGGHFDVQIAEPPLSFGKAKSFLSYFSEIDAKICRLLLVDFLQIEKNWRFFIPFPYWDSKSAHRYESLVFCRTLFSLSKNASATIQRAICFGNCDVLEHWAHLVGWLVVSSNSCRWADTGCAAAMGLFPNTAGALVMRVDAARRRSLPFFPSFLLSTADPAEL